MNNTLTVVPVGTRAGNPNKAELVKPMDILDRKIAMLETLNFDIGAKIGRAKIKHLHVYNYADIVPLDVEHTLIPAKDI